MSAENSTPPAPTNNFEQARAKAEAVLARKLNSQTIGTGDNSQFLNAKVQIDTGLAYNYSNEDANRNEVIQLTISTSQIEQFAGQTRDIIKKLIQEIEPLDAVVRARSAEEEIGYVKSKVEELINAGAQIPTNVLSWAGFDKRNDKSDEIADHLVSVRIDPYSVTAHVDLPEHLPSNASNNVATLLENNIANIKQNIAERIIKKTHTPEEKRQFIIDQVKQLHIVVKSDGDRVLNGETISGDLTLIIQSPEQKEAFDNLDIKDIVAKNIDPALAKTNILQSLDPVEINKIINHTLQHVGSEQDRQLMSSVIGTQDMHRKLKKVLADFGENHPDLSHQIEDILNSNVFEKKEWRDRRDSTTFTKKTPEFSKSLKLEERGKLRVDMEVPEGQVTNIIEKIAAMDKGAEQAIDPAAAKFASVDNVEVVGAHSPDPRMHQLLQQAIAPMIGQQVSSTDGDDKMKEFATRLIQLVTEAHEAAGNVENSQDAVKAEHNAKTMIDKVEEAYKNITEGIKHGAHQKAEAAIKEQAERAYTNANPNPQTPTTTMTPDWIQRLVKRTNDQSANYAMGA